MRHLLIILALATQAVAQEKPKPVKHSQEITRIKSKVDSLSWVQKQLQGFYQRQWEIHTARIEGQKDELRLRISELETDTVKTR